MKLKKSFLKHFSQKNCGSVTVEFALVSVLLVTLILSIIEVGIITFSQITVESTTNSTVRNIRTGNSGGTNNLKQYVRDSIITNAKGLVGAEKILITTDLDTDYNDIAKPEVCLANPPAPAGTCPSGAPFEDRNGNGVYDGDMPDLDVGGPGDRIRIRVLYPWTVLSPLLLPFLGQDGVVMITSTTFVVNEPA